MLGRQSLQNGKMKSFGISQLSQTGGTQLGHYSWSWENFALKYLLCVKKITSAITLKNPAHTKHSECVCIQ